MLEPYRVLDLSDERGLLAGKIMADLGADVIQIEPPGGSPARRLPPLLDERDPNSSAWWAAYACNKRGITLDLDGAEGREILKRLVATADFLFESDAPGVMAARGLGYAELAAINPRLVYVSITPFGQDGPKAHYAASDLVLWAAGGALLPAGGGLLAARDGDRASVRISVPQSYLHAAADAAAGALIAHFDRLKSGLGQHVDISAQQSVAQVTMAGILSHLVGHTEHLPRRADDGGLGIRKWRAKDGYLDFALGRNANNLMLWMHEEGACDDADLAFDWNRLRDVMTAGTANEQAEVVRLTELIRAFLASKTKLELLDAAATRRIILAPILNAAEVAANQHLADRNFWRTVAGDPYPDLRYPGPFCRVSGQPMPYRRPAPRLGEHNREVLVEGLGLSEAECHGAPSLRSRPFPRSDGGKELELMQAEATEAPRFAAAVGERGRGKAGPLAGITILDLTWVVAGPMIGRAFADFGATVIKVDSRRRVDGSRPVFPFHGGTPGPETSALYGNVNAGKLGITLNLATAEARDVLLDLVRWADVLTEAFTPGVMARWGLGYERLRQVKLDLIMLCTSINGEVGRYAGLSGAGNTGAAVAGIQELTGWPDRPPLGPSGPYTDYLAPRLAVPTLLAALDYRRRTGRGCLIDSSQAEAGIHFIAPAMLDYFGNGRVAGRAGNDDPAMAPHGVYRCRLAAGQREAWVAIAVRDDDDWRRFAHCIGAPELAADRRFATAAARLARRRKLDEIVAAWTAEHTSFEVERVLQERSIPAHAAIDSVAAAEDAQLLHRGHFVELPHPLFGRTFVETTRYKLSRSPAAIERCAPTYGRDNDYVLREFLGYDQARIEALSAGGALD